MTENLGCSSKVDPRVHYFMFQWQTDLPQYMDFTENNKLIYSNCAFLSSLILGMPLEFADLWCWSM